MYHYHTYGKQENRLCCESDFYNLYPSFDIEFYKQYYYHLSYMNDVELLNDYEKYGKNERRLINKSEINYEILNNSNLDKKVQFRFVCEKNIDYIRNLYLPDFCEKSSFESVLIEYRCFPHLEFLIRNTIIKLGDKWCHTIICGNLNYDFMRNMCSTISNKIKIIKTNYDNLFPSDYSRFLSSLDFWNLLEGEKILIYQEDSIIFKTNVDDFLKWDYIGAPWLEHQDDTNGGVGNGGISLRTKSVMMQVINTIGIDDVKMNKSTLNYMRNTNSTCPPEDVYFCKIMEDYSIGLLADRKSASDFSTESILNRNSFAGHNFWISDANWMERIFENNVIQFKKTFVTYFLEHRGGWKTILENLISKENYNNESHFNFFDMMETKFLWNKDYSINYKWCGIIHSTSIESHYLKNISIYDILTNENFMKSLHFCKFIITLSSYISSLVKNFFLKLNINVPVYTLKHPVVENNIIYFDYLKYLNNNNKKVIQIGQQLRKVSSIYLLDLNNFEKIWLSGTTNLDKCNELLNKEIEYLNIDSKNFKGTIKTYYTNTFEEYDELLSENIVFIDLFDAAANNTILECIIRNTPIIVNKLESIVEYLGEDYPLYFENLSNVPELLTNEKILSAHVYLSKINKDDLSIDNFSKKIINLAYNNFTYIKDSQYINKIICQNKNINEQDLYNIIINNLKVVCIYSPYEFTTGGGEKYLCDIITEFINNNYLIIFFNFTNNNLLLNTLKKYINIDNKLDRIIHASDIFLTKDFINRIYEKVEYFIYMFNFSIPGFKGFAKHNIFHCQFPFDIDNNIDWNKDDYINWNKNKKEEVLNSYQKIIVNSEFTFNHINDMYKFYNINYKYNISILYPCCIENKLFNFNPENKVKDTFVMVGRIFEHNPNANNKRFDIAINIFNELNDYDYKLILIGSVKNKLYYNKLQNMIGNNNKIKIYSDIDDVQKNNFLKESKYYIQLTGMEDTSVKCQEHFGISLIEALNYSCIPICYNGGYAPYIINNNINGLLINNRQELKCTLKNIMNNDLNIVNYNFDLDKYNKQSYVSNLNKIFEF